MVSGPTTFPDSRLRIPNQTALDSQLAVASTRYWPGIGVAGDGYVPVAWCDLGSGDWFYINSNDGSMDHCIAFITTQSVNGDTRHPRHPRHPRRLLLCCKITGLPQRVDGSLLDQIQSDQHRVKARIVSNRFESRINLDPIQSKLALRIRAIKPLKCVIRIASARVH